MGNEQRSGMSRDWLERRIIELQRENKRLSAENAAMRGLLLWIARLLASNNDYDDVLDWQQQYAAFLAAHPPA